MAMMNKRNMMMAAAVVVVLVVLYMFLGKSDNATAPFLTSGRSHIVPTRDGGSYLVKEAGWENFRGGFDKARKEHGEGVYVAHVTPCSSHNWGRPGGEVCQKYFKGKAPIHISQRVCSRSGFGGTASYVCLERPKPLSAPAAPVNALVPRAAKAPAVGLFGIPAGHALPPGVKYAAAPAAVKMAARVPRVAKPTKAQYVAFKKFVDMENKKVHDAHVRELEMAHKLRDYEKMHELSLKHSKHLIEVYGKMITELKHELDKAHNEIDDLHDDVEDLENNCR